MSINSIKVKFGLNLLSLVLGLGGLLGLFHSLKGYHVEQDLEYYSLLTGCDTIDVSFLRILPSPIFNPGLYPHKEIDTLYLDFERAIDWINAHRSYVDSCLKSKETIDLSLIGKPVIKSSNPRDLDEQVDKYLHKIESYNIHARKLYDCKDKFNRLGSNTHLYGSLSALCIILSYFFQLIIVVWTYLNEKKKSNKY